MKLRYIGVPILLLASGCMKNGSAAAPAATEAPGDAYWGGEEAMDDGGPTATATATSVAEPANAPPPEPERDMKRGRRWDRQSARSEVASPAQQQPSPAGSAGPSTKAEQAVEKPPQDDLDGRHIIYAAQMSVSVFNLEESMARAEALPETYGGYIQSMSEGNLVLRIPSKSLRKAMDDLADYGVVDHRSLQASDVTAEFTDIDSRIRALSETQKQLLELLTKARTVQEALEVRQALDGITTELEVLKGRMRQLENMISYSTLSVQLYERGPHVPTPSSNDPFPWVNELGVESTEWK